MLETLNKLFLETIKLAPEMWAYVLLGVIGLTFFITLIVGLASGEFNKVKSLMKRAIADPSKAVAVMQQMPVPIKKQYKHARLSNIEPSALVTENDCVTAPYRAAVISKLWIVTFVATVICIAIAVFVVPLAVQAQVLADLGGGEVETEAMEAAADVLALSNAVYIIPLLVAIAGGLFTFIGALIGHGALGGGKKVYAKFVDAIDGKSAGAPVQQPQQQAFAAQQEPIVDYAATAEPQPVYAESQYDAVAAEPMYESKVEDQPVIMEDQPSEEELHRRAEEALARRRAMEAEQQAQAAATARAQAAEQAQAAARAAQAKTQVPPKPQPQPQAAPQGGSSTINEVIARIEQIDREGAPRETMREVAALLQSERQKPENKTPEQQKRLNEALSKLLKAMSAASRK